MMFGGSSSNKAVCQFFLKGTCKYGTGCWNLHPQGQMGTSGGNVFGAGSSTSSSLFGGNKSNPGQETKELQDFIKQVSGEMNQWERSGQWLLSSFTPLKTSAPIPGFVDTSPEELRIEAYNANKTNTFATYQSQWNDLQNKHKQLREALKMSTPEAKEALKAVYNTKVTDGAQANPSNAFGGGSVPSSTPSVFGGSGASAAAASTSVFGAAAKAPGAPAVFGGAAAFGAAAASSSTSVFGQQNKSTFGAGASNSLFGASNSNPFNKAPVTPSGASSSLFGSATNTAQTSTFSNPQSTSTPNPFGGQTQGGVFGNAPANTGNIFGGGGQTPSVFGKPAQPTGTFGGNQTTSTLFGATTQPQSQTQSVFGGSSGTFGTPSSNTATPATASIFGSSGNSAFGAAALTQPSTTTSIFGGGNSGQPQPSASVFGGAGAASATSVFGGAAAAAIQGSSAAQGSVFGAATPSAAAATAASIFGAATAAASTPQAAASVFGAAAATPQSTASSVFGGGAVNTGVFGSTTAATIASSPFGASTTQPQTTTQAANPFGNAGPVMPSSIDTNKGDGTDVWYTPVDKLIAEDLKEFQAQSFTRVPLMPPPRNLCCIGA